MLGAIIGDIIGSPYEFVGRLKRTDFPLFSERSRPTDDSILTVATAHAIMRNEPYDEAYHRYGLLYPNAGFGSLFIEWLYAKDPVPHGSYGNGSAMMVSPVGWLFHSEEEVRREAQRSAECTHNHPEGIKGAVAAALMVFRARTDGEKESLKDVMKGLGYETERCIDEIRPSYLFDPTCQGCLPAVFRCVYEANSFEDAVRLAASLGGDADTLACIAGSIAEALWGIPEGIERSGMSLFSARCPELIEVVNEFWQFRNRKGPVIR